MSIEVRRIFADDWQVWRELRIRSLNEAPEAFAESAKSAVANNDHEGWWRARIDAADACFLAFRSGNDETAVGMVAVDPSPDERLQLVSMFVAPEVRRHGVGQQLIEAVVEVAAGRPLYLRVMEGNDAATRVYERAGFVLDGCDPDPESCLAMTYTG